LNGNSGGSEELLGESRAANDAASQATITLVAMEDDGCAPSPAGPRGLAAWLALQVFDAYPYGIVVVSREGRAIAHNPAAARLLGPLAARLDEPTAPIVCELFLRGLALISGAVQLGHRAPRNAAPTGS